jgi:Family of unknown function (DUF6152)
MQTEQRRTFIAAALVGACAPVWAHHGWSSFDDTRPIYLEGKATLVKWQNPHCELMLDLPANLVLPSDLAQRQLPAQVATVDGRGLLAKAVLPKRPDRRWEVELAPIARVQAWNIPEVKVGDSFAVLGYTFKDEKGKPILRAEYVWVQGKAYGLRSGPA